MTPLRVVVLWWLARMAELVPAALRDPGEAAADALLVDANGPSLALALRQRGQVVPLGQLDIAALTPAALAALVGGRAPALTLLRLPPGMLLEREVMLPLAAEADLDRVLAYEMDRFTPFAAADVYWSRGKASPDRAIGRLSVKLSLVPKNALARVVEALRAAGREPAELLAPASDGRLRVIGLATATAARPAARRAVPILATACAVLAVVAAALPIVQQYRALSDLDARMARLRPAVAEVEALRRRIAGASGGAGALASEETRLGNALRTIAGLTDLLPDDTFLTAMTLRQRQVTLNGQSADAARLIPRLSADPGLREVAFLAPVTRSGSSRTETFSIQLDLAP